MPKAEVGSTKWLSKNMKSKGLQRLRWYCQVCQRQMRDENGFKQHTQSEAHVRNMLAVGEDPRKFINEYSNQFKNDFLRLLRTAHGEKKVYANHFYQEYIHDKEHIHMNSTKWPSLTEFVKYLGREGICRVEEGDRGLEIAWVDDSPEALKRREAVAKKERAEKGEEERQARLLEDQIRRARELKAEKEGHEQEEEKKQEFKLERVEGQTIAFSLGGKPKEKPGLPSPESADKPPMEPSASVASNEKPEPAADAASAEPAKAEPAKSMSFSLGGGSAKSKPVNVFSSKNNPLKQKTSSVVEQPKKVSKLEEIMLHDKEEQERKRQRNGSGFGQSKRPRLG